MNIVENKLRELHITLPACPTPVAAYLPAVRAGNFVFASGQTPIVDGELLYQGKLGRDLGIEEGYEAARLAAIRVIAELKSVVGDLDRIERIVKVTGYVNSVRPYLRISAVSLKSSMAHPSCSGMSLAKRANTPELPLGPAHCRITPLWRLM